ncbi:ABC transporter protein [Perkinsela sp. CCAP 1560/4]|nr:ABC transporter protein [Perkinsela sp. CCAP 1560/4]|eukprot:KNH06345.1 ABC transporter protein [Perkinsela sp. CCAP 1560/4]
MASASAVPEDVLSRYDSTLRQVIRETMPKWDSVISSVDSAILVYILNTLQLQMHCHSRAKDDTALIEVLGGLFHETGIIPTLEEAKLFVNTLMESMKAHKILAKVTTNKSLEAPLNMRKGYSMRMQKNFVTPIGAGVKANFNSALDWEKLPSRSGKSTKNDRSSLDRRPGVPDQTREEDCVVIHRRERLKGNEDEIHCPNLTVCIGKTSLLENAELRLYRGHKYGLVGQNGSGKTTLMRLITEKEFEGISPALQIVHVEQEIPKSTMTPLECVLNTDVERLKLLQAEKKLLDCAEPNLDELKTVIDRLEEIDAHTAELRVKQILRGLSFTDDMMETHTANLSGGWRMRVALAKALFVKPDILFLDEPTNHLDLHAVLWLQAFLESWKQTLVIVSHNRSFLNVVCKEIIHLENKTLVYYKGNYDAFERTRLEHMQQHQRSYAAQEKTKAHMQTFINRFRCAAARAAQVQSRIKTMERLSTLAPLMTEAKLNFDFPSPVSCIDRIIQVSDMAFQYSPSSRMLLENVNLCITNLSRMGLVGANGSGKSTFLQLLHGDIRPTEGQVGIHPKAHIGMFTQHHVDSLCLSETSLETFQRKFGKDTTKFRGHLSRFGLRGNLQLQPIYTLSGGQKSRLAFAIMTFKEPDLLILDEPTNHLDIETVNALIEALIQYKGGVVLVSHDEYLINSVCTELYATENGTLQRLETDFNRYKTRVMKALEYGE